MPCLSPKVEGTSELFSPMRLSQGYLSHDQVAKCCTDAFCKAMTTAQAETNLSELWACFSSQFLRLNLPWQRNQFVVAEACSRGCSHHGGPGTRDFQEVESRLQTSKTWAHGGHCTLNIYSRLCPAMSTERHPCCPCDVLGDRTKWQRSTQGV